MRGIELRQVMWLLSSVIIRSSNWKPPKGSQYYTSFGDRASTWERKLTDLDDILNNLNAAQRKWVYLEPYQQQMKMKSPSQTGGFNYKEVFHKIDDDFRMIMSDCQKDTRVVAILKIGSVKSTLTAMLERLERCQKSLNEFLEEKRSRYICIFLHFWSLSRSRGIFKERMWQTYVLFIW